MQLAYFLRFCWCWLSQSLSPSTEKNLVELHALSAAAQLFSCIRIWARNGRVFDRHFSGLPQPSFSAVSPPAKLDDGYEGWVDGRDALTIPSLI
jgi:hypothetical protein